MHTKNYKLFPYVVIYVSGCSVSFCCWTEYSSNDNLITWLYFDCLRFYLLFRGVFYFNGGNIVVLIGLFLFLFIYYIITFYYKQIKNIVYNVYKNR